MKTKNYLILAILGLFLTCGCISMGSNTDGIATDSIARVSYGGWIWKTWRVELTNDHPISDGSGGMIAQRYGIENDPELIKRLQDLQGTGKKVKIYYHSKFVVYDWEFSDADVIYDVKESGTNV